MIIMGKKRCGIALPVSKILKSKRCLKFMILKCLPPPKKKKVKICSSE